MSHQGKKPPHKNMFNKARKALIRLKVEPYGDGAEWCKQLQKFNKYIHKLNSEQSVLYTPYCPYGKKPEHYILIRVNEVSIQEGHGSRQNSSNRQSTSRRASSSHKRRLSDGKNRRSGSMKRQDSSLDRKESNRDDYKSHRNSSQDHHNHRRSGSSKKDLDNGHGHSHHKPRARSQYDAGVFNTSYQALHYDAHGNEIETSYKHNPLSPK